METQDYYPYGAIKFDTSTGSFKEPRKYVGQIYDQDTGFDYLNARYYDANHSQFLSEDPTFLGNPKAQDLTDPQSLNNYSCEKVPGTISLVPFLPHFFTFLHIYGKMVSENGVRYHFPIMVIVSFLIIAYLKHRKKKYH